MAASREIIHFLRFSDADQSRDLAGYLISVVLPFRARLPRSIHVEAVVAAVATSTLQRFAIFTQ